MERSGGVGYKERMYEVRLMKRVIRVSVCGRAPKGSQELLLTDPVTR